MPGVLGLTAGMLGLLAADSGAQTTYGSLESTTKLVPPFPKAGGGTASPQSGTRFGNGVTSLGDLNKDGFDDVALTESLGGPGGEGAVWILFLDGDQNVIDHQVISAAEGDFTTAIDPGDSFGESIAALGDLDGDRIPDIVVGANADDDAGTNAGAIWIVFLEENGKAKDFRKIREGANGFTGNLDPADQFGRSVMAIGDLDADGVTDIAVGSELDDDGGTNRGAIYILFLNKDGTVKAHQKISSTKGGFDGTQLDDADRFGRSISLLGDVDNDGIADIAVGAHKDDDGGSNKGAVYVLFLERDGTVKDFEKINEASLAAPPPPSMQSFGVETSGLCDVNGDGVVDLAVAYRNTIDGLPQSGIAILFLDATGAVTGEARIPESDVTGSTADTAIATGDLTVLGDLDGDGTREVLVSADGDDEAGTDVGAAWILSLNGPTPMPPPLTFELIGLGGDNGFDFAGATSISDDGRITGAGFDAAGVENAMYWYLGVATHLIPPANATEFSRGLDVNGSGHIVGHGNDGPANNFWVYWDGMPPPIPLNGGSPGFAFGINNNDLVCGFKDGFPVVLPLNGAPTFLAPLTNHAYTTGRAQDVNDDGVITGFYADSNQSRAVIWDGAGVHELPLLPGGNRAAGRRISSDNVVVGHSLFNGQRRPVVWRDHDGPSGPSIEMLPVPAGTIGQSGATGLAVHDGVEWVVGDHRNCRDENRALVWLDGAMHELSELIPGQPGWQLLSANDINDDLWIVGTGINPQGKRQAFLLRPTNTDQDPPTVAITSPAPDSIVGSTTVLTQATITDESGTVVQSIPGGINVTLPAGGGTAQGTLPLAVEGENTLTVNAEDEFGNTGGSSVTVIRDTIAPTVLLLSPVNGAVVADSQVDVSVDVSDATATVVSFPNGDVALPAGGGLATLTLTLTEGETTIAIDVTDAAGNTTPASTTVTLDLTAPVITFDDPVGGECYGVGEQDLAVVATIDDASSTTVSSTPGGVSGSLPAGGGIVTGVITLAEGSNTISLAATDAVAKTSTESVTVVLDTTAPAIEVVSPVGGDVVRDEIDLHVTADDPLPGSGVALVELRVDGTLVETLTTDPFETLLDTTLLADGAHDIEATALDGKGNGSSETVSVAVDNTAPTAQVVTPSVGAHLSGVVPFQVSAADGGSGLVAISLLAGGAVPTTDDSATYDPPTASDVRSGSEDTSRWPDGALTFSVEVQDAAGNVHTASVTVQIDNTAPDKTLLSPTGGDVVAGTIPIVAESTDPNLASIEVRVDGASIATSSASPLSTSFDTTQRLDGEALVRVIVTDLAGNESSCTASVTIDNISLRLRPRLLNLRSRGFGPVRVRLEGSSVGLLLPTEDHGIELRVPGGSPVRSIAGYAGDDQLVDHDGDGVPELKIRFKRRELIASIKAGIAAGLITGRRVEVTVFAEADDPEGGTVLGTQMIRIRGG